VHPEEQERLQAGPSSAATLHRAGFVHVVAYFGPVGDQVCTNAEATYYQTLAAGKTVMAAGQAARMALMAELEMDGSRYQYPLGWAQLALGHRGPDRPLCAPRSGAPPRRRYQREETVVNGLPILTFGFIGRRREQHLIRRAYEGGQRLFVLQGLGGLGKTALARRLVTRVLAEDGRDAAILRCKDLADAREPLAELWRQAEQIGRDWELPGWEARCAEAREALKGRSAAEGLRETVRRLRAGHPRMVLYIDNAETLQTGPVDTEPGTPAREIGQWRPTAKELWPVMEALAAEGLPVLISTRYLWAELDPDDVYRIGPLTQADVRRMIDAFEKLGRLPGPVKGRIAWQADGHGRTIEFLETLVADRLRQLGRRAEEVSDPWAELVEPLLPDLNGKITQDLLLEQLWQALPADARRQALGAMLLRAPAPERVIDALGGQRMTLENAGVLTPFARTRYLAGQVMQERLLGVHSVVTEFVADREALTDEQAEVAHRAVGEAYSVLVGEPGAFWADQAEAIHHLHAAGDGDRVWPLVREYVLEQRKRGRYGDAQAILARCEAAATTGDNLARALCLQGEMHSGMGEIGTARRLMERSLELVRDDLIRSYTLHALSGVLSQQGNFAEAERLLRQSLDIKRRTIGEDNPSYAASLANLAGVLAAQGRGAEALPVAERAVAVLARVLGADNWMTLQAVAVRDGLGGAGPTDPAWRAMTAARQAARAGDMAAAIQHQRQAIEPLREAGEEREALVDLSVALYNLAGCLADADRLDEAVAAMEEVVALDRRTGHEDLASDTALLESLRQRAAMSPEERATGATATKIADIARQAAAATSAVRQGKVESGVVLAQLDAAAAKAAEGEAEGSAWLDLACFIRACAALLRCEAPEPVPPAFAEVWAALQEITGG